jgi:hypothetical protein
MHFMQDGKTPLHLVVENKVKVRSEEVLKDMVELLLERGAHFHVQKFSTSHLFKVLHKPFMMVHCILRMMCNKDYSLSLKVLHF